MGYYRAGFDVLGVDIRPQPRYPFEFVQEDALRVLHWLTGDWHEPAIAGWLRFADIDAIHASPPCQAYSVLRHAAADKGNGHVDFVAPTRELLEATGLPYVIENVPGAPLHHLVVLCGSMFGLGAGGRQLRRHRLFEVSFPMMSSPCQHHGEAIGVYGGGPVGRYTFGNGAKRDRYGRRGGYQGTADETREAMGIDWMNRTELIQAIPPAYTEHIGGYLMAEIKARAVAP